MVLGTKVWALLEPGVPAGVCRRCPGCSVPDYLHLQVDCHKLVLTRLTRIPCSAPREAQGGLGAPERGGTFKAGRLQGGGQRAPGAGAGAGLAKAGGAGRKVALPSCRLTGTPSRT